MVMVLLAGLG
jgi:hypothetical protein